MNTGTISLQIPGQVKTLYEASQLSGGMDICDKDWDIAVFFECGKDWKSAKDGYDKLMLLFGINIAVDKYDPDWYTTCAIGDFMWANRDVFDAFFNQHNGETFRPCNYKELDPEMDTGFYEAYMMPFESLLAGNYSDKEYEELYKMLAAKAEQQNSEKSQENSN